LDKKKCCGASITAELNNYFFLGGIGTAEIVLEGLYAFRIGGEKQ
jgi:hypothetical protein